VREALLGLQRRLGEDGGVVLEGRDIGTVVFPDAEVKLFLTASVEVRGRRRHDELLARGERPDLARIVAEIAERDAVDANRAVAPLRPAPDATVVDTSGLPMDEVVASLVAHVRGAD
jgi:cytidylate kinase